MANDPEFQNLIDTLLKGKNAADRMKAAKSLGDYVKDLSNDEYEQAKKALDRAMTDADPMVLMAAMQSMTKYTRGGGIQITGEIDFTGDTKEDLLHPPTRTVCKVCGRPEALIHEDGCERDDCPYK
jgi:predicted O-methyltransferase YrrM